MIDPETLPDRLVVGAGTALALDGSTGGERPIAVAVGENERPVLSWRERRRGRWGFSAVLAIEPVAADRESPVNLIAGAQRGASVSSELGRIALVRDPERAPAQGLRPGTGGGPLVAICVATHEPPPELFRAQIESIRAQAHGHWVCLISDDASGEAAIAMIEDEIGGDERFALSRSSRRLGFYANFERALGMVPAEAELVALCDQDDRWHPGKLERLIAALGPDPVTLAFSDMRIVDERGGEIASSFWTRRRNEYADLGALLLANTVTGAASLFRSSLLEDALPFPPPTGGAHHDHWLALVALSLGEIAYVDEPLHDYVQHPGAALGHARANLGLARRASRAGADALALLTGPSTGARRLRHDLFARAIVFATVLELRLGDRLAPPKRAAIGELSRQDEEAADLLALSWRAARHLRHRRVGGRFLRRERARP